MFNFLKKRHTIPENEFGITQEDIRHILNGTQTWGTDKKVYDLFIEHMEHAWASWTPREPFTLVKV